MYNTTNAHFELFKKESQRWINNLGLRAWDVKFKHEHTTEDRLAWVQYSVPGGWCTFHLNTDWSDEKPNRTEIIRAAMHEVGELLIAKLDYLARERSIDAEELGIEGHKIINAIINCYFENSAAPKRKYN